MPASEHSNHLREFTHDNFEEDVLKSAWPVLIDFSAQWCTPCRAIEPIVQKLAKEYAGRAMVGRVDIDTEQDLARKYHVQNIPTFIVLRNGAPIRSLAGPRAEHVLREALDEALSPV